MASAFEPALSPAEGNGGISTNVTAAVAVATAAAPAPSTTEAAADQHCESETEDEEVKVNCIGGRRGMEDSDINSSDDDEDDDVGGFHSDAAGDAFSVTKNGGGTTDEQDEPPEDETTSGQGVVTFVADPAVVEAGPLVRPNAQHRDLSPHLEGEDENGDSSSSSDEDEDAVDDANDQASHHGDDAMGDASSEEEGGGGVDDCEDDQVVEHDEEQEDMVSTVDVTGPGGGIATSNTENDHDGQEEDDDELSGILEALVDSNDEEDGGSPAMEDPTSSEGVDEHVAIGCTEDRYDVASSPNVPKPKRMLSYNTLTALNTEAKHDVPKRSRTDLPFLPPSFTLGPSALSVGSHELKVLPSPARLSIAGGTARWQPSPVVSSSEEEDLDRQLVEELREQNEFAFEDDDDSSLEIAEAVNTTDSGDEGDNATHLVALLTPPQSPLTIQVNGETAQVCEWPSNLAVDIANAAACDDKDQSLRPSAAAEHSNSEQPARRERTPDPSTLTPLLRSIYVG